MTWRKSTLPRNRRTFSRKTSKSTLSLNESVMFYPATWTGFDVAALGPNERTLPWCVLTFNLVLWAKTMASTMNVKEGRQTTPMKVKCAYAWNSNTTIYHAFFTSIVDKYQPSLLTSDGKLPTAINRGSQANNGLPHDNLATTRHKERTFDLESEHWWFNCCFIRLLLNR